MGSEKMAKADKESMATANDRVAASKCSGDVDQPAYTDGFLLYFFMSVLSMRASWWCPQAWATLAGVAPSSLARPGCASWRRSRSTRPLAPHRAAIESAVWPPTDW